jgi:hypothetical protein
MWMCGGRVVATAASLTLTTIYHLLAQDGLKLRVAMSKLCQSAAHNHQCA